MSDTAVTANPDADSARRQRLLADVTDYILRHGLADLSLRPLAAALGTSARMLIYYFGSRDQLIVDALAEVRRRHYADLRDGDEPLRAYWGWARSHEGRTYLRLVYEVFGLGLRDPGRFASFPANEAIEVLRFIEEGYREAGVPDAAARALSTYTFAALRGFELDLLGTGDLARVNAAFEMLHEDLERRVEALTRTVHTKRRK
jgi:AcrR family transcriptional regulator